LSSPIGDEIGIHMHCMYRQRSHCPVFDTVARPRGSAMRRHEDEPHGMVEDLGVNSHPRPMVLYSDGEFPPRELH